ncbi:stage II sporulation protein D [Paenibacillus senegalensis]|uniref:stage II sporulation protein D n=1 Tax=Paenibacillus senegalensis TaxID=1465766 RepID=UPI00028A33EB|nr:stage II sporulation protein D [Paenibacillus senegalensis]
MNERMRHKALWWMAAALSLSMLLTIMIRVWSGEEKTVSPLPPSADSPQTLEPSTSDTKIPDQPLWVPVYLSTENKVDQIQLEDYVRGVVAAEMPAEFEPAALQAQALAARTYIVRRWMTDDRSNVPVQDALVTDTITHQAYQTDEMLLDRWGSQQYESYYQKIEEAVKATQGMILTYEKQPIEALFFSTSNGRTENSEDYWEQHLPYLRSVESPWDEEISPRYTKTVSLAKDSVLKALGISSSLSADSLVAGMDVTEYSAGGRVKSVRVAGQTFTGREIREKLQLDSSQFYWKANGNSIDITTYGYGHGVGMSQWGANGMAKEGYTAEEIVKHYYKGIDIQPWAEIVNIAN